MNKSKIYFGVFVTLIAFILLHNNILIFLANVSSAFRNDNSCDLDKAMYDAKIESLERQILEYENSYNNLKIYDSSTYVLSKIALRDIYDFYNYLIITPNTIVKKGSAVINEDGLVGIIKSSDTKTAKVELLTKGSSVSVKIRNSYGLIKDYDKKARVLIINNINNYEVIEIGDEVVTSGLQELTGGIKVGRVENIENVGIEKVVYVKSYVDFDNLNYLYVENK